MKSAALAVAVVLAFSLYVPLQAQTVLLDNDYVRVTKDQAPCASASAPGCGVRVIVALGQVHLGSGSSHRMLERGDFAVFRAGQSHAEPEGDTFFEVAFKQNRPPVQSPDEIIPPEKNTIKYEGDDFFIFEENLGVGDTRARHSHSQRVVIQLNRTRLHYWVDGQPEYDRDIVPDGAAFNGPVVHTVKNVGELPLRGVVIEYRPERRPRGD